MHKFNTDARKSEWIKCCNANGWLKSICRSRDLVQIKADQHTPHDGTPVGETFATSYL